MAKATQQASVNISALWTRVRKPLISIFIFFYIYSVVLWLCPPNQWRSALLRPVERLVLFLGLWQTFTVFSPDPRKTNLHLDAQVIFSDGSALVWEYPRLEKMSIWERIPKSHYRKFGHDHLNWYKNRFLWPDYARYIARMHASGAVKPVTIVLRRHWAKVPPPEKGLNQPPPDHTNEYVFFKYQVKPEDLK